MGLTDTAINVLWIDTASPNVLLAGTEFGGLFRTSKVSFHAPVSAIVSISNGVLAGTGAGFEFSGDDGATWTVLHTTNSPVRCVTTAAGNVVAGLESSPAGSTITSPAPVATRVSVKFGTTDAVVQSAGIVSPGLFQLNVIVPSTSGPQWENFSPPVFIAVER